MIELALGQTRLTEDVVENLQFRMRELCRVEQPVDERAALDVVSEVVHRGDGEGGIAQPAVAIVPIANAADALRQ